MQNLKQPTSLQKGTLPFRSVLNREKLGDFKFPLVLTASHIFLGPLLYNAGILALLHPILVFGLGLYFAVQKHVRLEKVAFVVGYIGGVEVLWRMANVPTFWEGGKFGSAIIMIVALAQRKRWRIPNLPLVYFVCLIPACLVTASYMTFGETRNSISFVLSGPLLLFVSCWFFSHLRVDVVQLKRLFVMILIPLMSVAVTTLFYTVTAPVIQFNTESNFATSGGYGPNQVSAILGLGVLVSLSTFLLFKNSKGLRLFLIALAALFTAQSLLTFSRGGLYNAAGALLITILFQFHHFKRNAPKLVPIIGATVLFIAFIFPYMNEFTGGKLEARFGETDTTQRGDIVLADLQIFVDNPFSGVGVGRAYEIRKLYLNHRAVSHTEFGRMVAEHGILGLVSLAAFGLMVFYNVKRHRTGFGRAFTAGLIVWSVLFMANTGMRLAAPSIALGICFITLTYPKLKKADDPTVDESIKDREVV